MARGLRLWAAGLAVAVPVTARTGGDIDAGARIFKLCVACHSLTDQTRKVGPTLNGVFGRRAGTVPGYKYSTFMVMAGEAGLIWDEAELAAYLADPKSRVPNNSMAFGGLKTPQDVADVVAYIRRFSPD